MTTRWWQWLPHERAAILIFTGFNLILGALSAFAGEPLLLHAIAALALIALGFVLVIPNFLECLLLLLFVFAVELLYNYLGLWAVIGAFVLVLSLALMRSFVEGFTQWRERLFTRELLLFLGVILASLFWGKPAFNGYRLFGLNLVLGVMVFALTHFTLSSFRSLHYSTLILIVVLALNALYAIFHHLSYGVRATSLFVETPTYSGHYFVQGFALAAGAFFSPPFRRLRGFLVVALITLLVALFLTLTRAAWLAFFFLILLSAFFSRIPKRYLLAGGIGVGVTVLLAFVFVATDAFNAMLKARIATDIQSANVSVGSIAFRVLLWQSAWNLFLANPLLGIGFDNFLVLNALTPNFPIIRALGGENLYVHNIYLQTLAETGLVGFLALVILLISIYAGIAAMLRHTAQHRYRFLLLGYAGVVSLWLFMGLTEASLYTPVTAVFFFFILGVLSGFHKLLQREAATTSGGPQRSLPGASE